MKNSILENATDQMANSKKALLMAAIDLFTKKGIDGVSLGDISQVSKYSRPVLFKFYSTKMEMAIDLFSICYRGLYQKYHSLFETNMCFKTQLNFFCEISAQVIIEDADAFFMVSEHLRVLWPLSKGLNKSHSLVSLTKKMIERGKNENMLIDTISIDDLAAAVMGVVQQFARMHYFSNKKKSKKELAQILFEICQRVLIETGK